jgi:RNA polymerase sigma factor (sigma-70 family)
MQDDTFIGGHLEKFPTTHLSAVTATSSGDPAIRAEAYTHIIQVYWKPVYKYIRVKWHKTNEDAKDLTQAFFMKVMEKEFFRSYDHIKSRFRTFLRVCLDRFVANEDKAAGRIKRGGSAQFLSLDFEGADEELAYADVSSGNSVEEYFDKEWARHIFGIAVEKLKSRYSSEDKPLRFQLFEFYHLADDTAGTLTYEQVASRFNLSVSDVTNYLAAARREFRKLVLDELRSLTMTDQEFRQEARELLGIDPA